MRSRAVVAAIAALAMLAFAACGSEGSSNGSEGSSNGSEGSTKGDRGTQVAVALDDYSIEPSGRVVPTGDITFSVENVGATEHEMVVIRTDLDPADIPVENHEANEEAPGMTPMGEVEDVQPGASTELKLTLEPGSYILLCNIAKHFERGMVTEFQVS
jgi:uncharacterized cupredoxin-like copper-binding protein